MTKTEARIGVALELLQKVHSDLCIERKIDQARELSEIIRRLVVLDIKPKKKKENNDG